MTPNEYQMKAKTFDLYPSVTSWLCHSLGLASEAGEVAGKIKKLVRDKDGYCGPEDAAKVADELGDCLWYIAMLAHDFKIPLGQIMRENIEKLTDRAIRGKIGGSGDNR